MNIIRYTPTISLVELAPDNPYFAGFLSAYVLRGEKAAIIDPGPTAFLGTLFSALEKMRVNPEDIAWLLASHIHLDHTAGCGAALKRLPNARVIVHARGRPHLIDHTRLWEASRQTTGEAVQFYGEPEPVPDARMVTAADGMVVDLGRFEVEVIPAPGHATHGLCFYDRAGKNLFEGEALGVYLPEVDVIRLSAPPPFNPAQMLATIDRLIELEPEAIYFSHFGRADNARRRLAVLKETIYLWGRIIAGNLHRAPADILELIRKEDGSLKKIRTLSPRRQEREWLSLTMSIRGYTEYFRKSGTAVFDRNV